MTTLTRRAALKTLAATLIAPCVTLRQSVDREALLSAFCDDGKIFRYDLGKPFSINSLTYATDARHAVRAELSSVVTDGERRTPNMEATWAQFWKPNSLWRGLDREPELLLPIDKHFTTCPACGNRRICYGDYYPDQDEMSRLVDTLDYDVDDNTHRDESCQLCHGQVYEGPSEIELAGVRIVSWRAKPILALPNLRIAASNTPDCLLFTADGFEGIAMGIIQ